MTDQLHPTAPADHHYPYAPTAPAFGGGAGLGSVPPTPYGYGAAPAGFGDGGWPPHAGPPQPGRGRSHAGWIVAGALLLVVLLAGAVTTAILMLGSPSPAAPATPTAPAAPAVSAPSVVPAPAVPAAPAPSVSTPASGSGGSGRTLSTVLPASAGPLCGAYTPSSGEYVTSRGNQASEVRACAIDGGGVVFTRWGSAADAASVVSDQASFSSADGKSTWTMGGTTQGDWHERKLDDGSCMAAFDYTGKPYSVLITAPSCSAVGTLFQDTTLPDISTVPAS